MTTKIKCKLESCSVEFTPTNAAHVFHSDACRAQFRRENTPGTGIINGLRQIKGGRWSITIHMDKQPDAQIGQKVSLNRD